MHDRVSSDRVASRRTAIQAATATVSMTAVLAACGGKEPVTPFPSTDSSTDADSLAQACGRPDTEALKDEVDHPRTGLVTAVNWHFDSTDIHQLDIGVTANAHPGDDSNIFFQLYDGHIGNGSDESVMTSQYFGIQWPDETYFPAGSTAKGRILWSQFGSRDTGRVKRQGLDTYVVDDEGVGEGAFISARCDIDELPLGRYVAHLVRGDASDGGDLWSLGITLPNGRNIDMGTMWFPRQEPDVPTSLTNNGGTWMECWDFNNLSLLEQPVADLTTRVVANGNLIPIVATASYGEDNVPNTDISAVDDGAARQVFGGYTPRCHVAGDLWNKGVQPSRTAATPSAEATLQDVSFASLR